MNEYLPSLANFQVAYKPPQNVCFGLKILIIPVNAIHLLILLKLRNLVN